MARLIFEAIPGTYGEYSEHGTYLTVKVPSIQVNSFKECLTVVNKSSGFRMRQIMNSIDRMNHYGAPPERIAAMLEEYRELQTNQKREYYERRDANTFIIPPGFWYLCERIEGDRHHNIIVPSHASSRSRSYQTEALKTLMKYKRATAVLATGLGKTQIISDICSSFIDRGGRVCVVVPTEALVGQMMDTISKVVPSTTGAGGGRNPKLGHDVLVTTAASAIKYIDVYDVVIIDESHRSSAKTWENLLLAAEKAQYVYNLTATPFRADGMDLGIHAFGGPVVFERDARWGIENGWLSPLEVFFCNVVPKDRNDDPINVPSTKSSSAVYRDLVVCKEVNQLLVNNITKAVGQGKRVIVFYKTVNPGKVLLKLLKGVKAGLATAKSKKVIQDFRDGKINVMISNDKLVGEGVDIPDADIVFQVLQNSSDTTTTQVAGRIMRIFPGKTKGALIDVCIHGFGQYENAGLSRLKIYRKITDTITVIGKLPKRNKRRE